ncbi:MAG TPA: glycosyltransferase family 39 protein [Kiritimatiellia bacterium]|nr:glycosyltransferase family 39 protein [Kiritimatiellia bacterium]
MAAVRATEETAAAGSAVRARQDGKNLTDLGRIDMDSWPALWYTSRMDPKESWMPMLLLLLFGIAILFQMPQQAADTEIVPDSIEYAFGALNLATGNGYQIQVGGRPLPPRYPPWFSAMLVPAYWILGDDPGNGIVMVFVLAMIGVLAAYKIGERISGPWGGAGAGLLLLVFTDYHYYGRQIMTDVPCTAILLLVLWLGCSIRERPRNWKWGLVGVLLACAAALRPVSAAFLLPFLVWRWQMRKRQLEAVGWLLWPMVVMGMLSAGYNRWAFGSYFRSGYAYWCAIPYDYPNLVYSFRYIPQNVSAVWRSHLIWAVAVLGPLLWFARRKTTVAGTTAGMFILLGGGPILLFHLIYFFPDPRFFLPLAASAAVLCGGLLGVWVQRFSWKWLVMGQMVMLTAGLVAASVVHHEAGLRPRRIAEAIKQETPAQAVIVTALPPAYLENYPGIQPRLIVPLSRKVEYADKLILKKKVPALQPMATHWWEHRQDGLLAAGAEEVIPWTAVDQPECLAELIAANRPVWVDRQTVPGHWADFLAQHVGVRLEKTAAGRLYRLRSD